MGTVTVSQVYAEVLMSAVETSESVTGDLTLTRLLDDDITFYGEGVLLPLEGDFTLIKPIDVFTFLSQNSGDLSLEKEIDDIYFGINVGTLTLTRDIDDISLVNIRRKIVTIAVIVGDQ